MSKRIGLAATTLPAQIGSHQHDVFAANDGAAYVFELSFSDCNDNGVPDACDIASGATLLSAAISYDASGLRASREVRSR